MIKFEGEHSQECAKFICKVHQKYSFLTALFPLVLVEIPVFIMSFSCSSYRRGYSGGDGASPQHKLFNLFCLFY